MGKSWLNYMNLSDDYERRARFIPGILSILPLLPVSAVYGERVGQWVATLLVGVGLGAIISVGLSHIASAFGNRIQKQLWPNWPHDSPTNQWLHPQNGSVSKQQKQLWYKALKNITGLDIEATIQKADKQEIKAIINDAVMATRGLLWKAPAAERLRLYNIDYGFARNLTGLRSVWILFAMGSAAGCWAGYFWYDGPLVWCIISSFIALAVFPLGFSVLPAYVRRKAHFYAEAFFDAVVVYDRKKKQSK